MSLPDRRSLPRYLLLIALEAALGCHDTGPPVSPEEMRAEAVRRAELGRRMAIARDSARRAWRATPPTGTPFVQGIVAQRGTDWIIVVALPGAPTGGATGRRVRATFMELTGVFRRESVGAAPRPTLLDSVAVGQLVSVWQQGRTIVAPPVDPLPVAASAVVIEPPASAPRRRARPAV
jgi:hypothetical protein